MIDQVKIIEVTAQNVKEETLFCVKDITSPGFENKRKWFEKRHEEGLRMKILKNSEGKMMGFIEYVPVAHAWRPIDATNLMFIHCMCVFAKKDRNKGYGSLLISEAEKAARKSKMDGMCVMASKGAWIANKNVFEQNGFKVVGQRGRFELVSKKWNADTPDPKLIDWTAKQKDFQGWHLLYANQCPWHEKSVVALLNTSMDFDIDLKVTRINTAEEAKNAPSGYGVFSLLHNGKLLEDHYISATRFKNIIKKDS